jgi:hypothetical protein
MILAVAAVVLVAAAVMVTRLLGRKSRGRHT